MAEKKETPTPLAQSARTINSAAVGTTPVTGAGAVNGITINQWTNTATDLSTPITLLDSNGAPSPGTPGRVIFSVNLTALECLLEPRPTMPLTPGLTAPTWPKTLVPATTTLSFMNGLYIASCPANVTATATA